MANAYGKKKSLFTEQSSIPTGATFDFVFNQTNYKIPVEDMIAAFGTTGTLSQVGDSEQTPILNVDGVDNQIRNLEDGPGVKASVSEAGGAKLSHNFGIGTSGQAVLINTASSSPTIRNLVAGDGIGIAADGKNLQISVTGEEPAASNIIVVNEMSDFPAAVEGVRTLGDNSAYLVSARLTTADRFVLGSGCFLYGADSSVASLEYIGEGTMFTGLDVSAKISLLEINAPNGAIFNISATVPGKVFQFVNITISNCDSLGIIQDITALQITDVFINSIVTSGLMFFGTIGLFVGTRNVLNIDGGTLLDFGTSIFSEGFTLESSFVSIAAGATFIDGLADSGNMDTGALGAVFNTRFNNSGTLLNNISETDARWAFLLNDEIPDSITSILGLNSGTSIAIDTIDTPVLIGASWSSLHESRFIGTAAGRFTYTGLGTHVNINVAISAELDGSPGSNTCTFYLYKNGIQITGSATSRALTTGNPGSVSLVWQEDLATSDYLELFVENNDDIEDITILNVNLGVS